MTLPISGVSEHIEIQTLTLATGNIGDAFGKGKIHSPPSQICQSDKGFGLREVLLLAKRTVRSVTIDDSRI